MQKIFSSNPPKLTETLSAKFAFLAGAGGLGSNLATMLVRAGIGRLAICDFDIVSEANLNRQAYFIDQIGMLKVEAISQNLLRINPECKIDKFDKKLSSANFAEIIPSNIDIIFECYDDAGAKAELFSYCISKRKDTPLIMVSGLAGTAPSDEIRARKIASSVWLVGDERSEMNPQNGTLSSRVMLAAATQAHLGIRILLGLEK